MRLLSLNIQGGAQSPRFLQYIRQQKRSTDVFCFQEVFDSKAKIRANKSEYMDIYSQLKRELKGFNAYFYPVSNTVGKYFKLKNKAVLGLAIFIKKRIQVNKFFGKHVEGSAKLEVDFENGREVNAVQCLQIQCGKESLWILNFHGQSRPGNKLDTSKRIRQSKIISTILNRLKGHKILCGDFNLMPNTKSIKMIENIGMKNLIKIYKIKNTRNSISWKRYNNRQHFADFTFVSPKIKIGNFTVPYNLASDHLPMILKFNI